MVRGEFDDVSITERRWTDCTRSSKSSGAARGGLSRGKARRSVRKGEKPGAAAKAHMVFRAWQPYSNSDTLPG